MNLKKAYAVDEESANKGKWTVTQMGMRIRVAKAGNQQFINEVVRLQKPYLQLFQSGVDTADLLTDITAEAMAKTVLMDWEADEGGEDIPYTWELGKEAILTYPDFREDISLYSDNRRNFQPEEVAKK